MKPDFKRRATNTELMDDLEASGPDLDQALRELDTINALLGGNRATLDGVAELLKHKPQRSTIHVADLGCGSGDMLRRIKRKFNGVKHSLVLTGIDANANAIEFAQVRTQSQSDIFFEPLNIFSSQFHERNFDIVTASLFFHHFTSDQLAILFKRLKDQVSIGFVINDIHRHPLAYYAIKGLTALFSRSRMVKNDAPLSVLRAFTKSELTEILQQAGITAFRIRWRWAFRWQVVVFSQPKDRMSGKRSGRTDL